MSKANTSYTQKFRPEWLKDPEFKPWFLEVPGQSNKAKCKACKVILTARAKDLKDHMASKKHTKAMEPFSPESTQTQLPFQPV